MYAGIKNDGFVKSPRSVILRSGATKNLNDIRFFAIAQNDKRVFFRLFTKASIINVIIEKVYKESITESIRKDGEEHKNEVQHMIITYCLAGSSLKHRKASGNLTL